MMMFVAMVTELVVRFEVAVVFVMSVMLEVAVMRRLDHDSTVVDV